MTEQAQHMLRKLYPEAEIKVLGPEEVVAMNKGGHYAAIIGVGGVRRHFHQKMVEAVIVRKGTLAIECQGDGYVVGSDRKGPFLIPPGQIHGMAGVGKPAMIEVVADPWSEEDYYKV